MIRKLGHIIIFILLLTATTGMAVSRHYCNGVLISSSVYFDAKSCCEGDCCRNQAEFYQLNEKFQSSGFLKLPQVNELTLFVSLPELLPLPVQKEIIHIRYSVNESPPPDLPTYLSLIQSYLL